MKYKPGTFSTIPNKEIMRGKPTELQVLHFWLCERADAEGICFPSRPKIAQDCGIKSLRTVDKYIKELVDMGILVKTKRKDDDGVTNKSNLYQIMLQELQEVEHEIVDPGATDALDPRAPNGTITIPIDNYTHLTQDTDVPSLPIQKEIDTLNRLPPKYGSSTLLRLVKVYNALWRKTYSSAPGLTNIGRFGKAVNKILAEHTEMQVAVLIHTYYHWYGGSGNDQKEHNYLVDAGFPIEMILNKVGIMVAYLTNNIGLEYTNPDKVKAYAIRNLKDVL